MQSHQVSPKYTLPKRILFIWKSKLARRGETKSERQRFSIYWLSPLKCLQQSDLGQAEAKNFFEASQAGGKDQALGHLQLYFHAISRHLDQSGTAKTRICIHMGCRCCSTSIGCATTPVPLVKPRTGQKAFHTVLSNINDTGKLKLFSKDCTCWTWHLA